MPSEADAIQFAAYHRPALPDGEYLLEVTQHVQIDPGDQWSTPTAQLYFSVSGPRFDLDPALIQSQFPPPKSIGQYYNVLPHIILDRTTLPWERTIDHSVASTTATQQPPPKQTPWMALLLFDETGDKPAPIVTRLTLKDLLDVDGYKSSATPPHKPEFVRLLDKTADAPTNAKEPWLKLEIGQHVNDRLTVIDVPRPLLWQIMPGADELAWLSHVRAGLDHLGNKADFPVIFCNRLPAAGTRGENGSATTGTQSTVHLVSLEGRQPLLDALDALKTKPADDKDLVRFVSLASWSFATFQENKTFQGWLKEASGPADGVHTLRMPVQMPDKRNPDAERFLAQGYAPITHQTRQGNHLVSWYRSPLVPGPSPAAEFPFPVRMSDELVRYFKDVGMFDTTYAAAWELGRMLTLRSKKVSLSLINWKRAHAKQAHQVQRVAGHLPFAPDHDIANAWPDVVWQWFKSLLILEHVPFHYLVPRGEMLPANSLRFFHVDKNWLECLLDGALSIGRTISADIVRDKAMRDALPKAETRSGFLLRSPVVSGWPHLGVEAYTQAFNDQDEHVGAKSAATCLRFDRPGKDVLLCLFDGDIKTVDIHEHRDTIHFGVDPGDDPSKIEKYTKRLRGQAAGTPLHWRRAINKWRTLDIASLAGTMNAAEFAVAMIEGVEKVRFTALKA